MKSLPNIFIYNHLTRKVITSHTEGYYLAYYYCYEYCCFSFCYLTYNYCYYCCCCYCYLAYKPIFIFSLRENCCLGDFYYQCADKYDGSSMVEVFNLKSNRIRMVILVDYDNSGKTWVLLQRELWRRCCKRGPAPPSTPATLHCFSAFELFQWLCIYYYRSKV